VSNDAKGKPKKRVFYAVIEVDPDAGDGEIWDGDKFDVAAWIESGMCGCSKFEADPTVWDNITDFINDNSLEALADI